MLIYHLWPASVRGGFVGVDVFFVISGFLITSHLLSNPPTDPRGLLQFWSRRIRRLLPASLLVLAVTLIASRLVAPETQWRNIAVQVKAAALYVVNWRLADDSVDYLAAKNAPTPVQHFWSLSVEEQFYLGWPVLIFLLALATGRLALRRRRVAMTTGLAAVVAASFVYSMALTASDPARAYFVTPTRIWELGLGGLLAALVSPRLRGSPPRVGTVSPGAVSPGARSALAWAGLAGIVWCCLAYSGGTPFPGWRALAPVAGAVAVIAASAPAGRWSPYGLFALRPVRYLGDISYSLYLWHWPLIVLVPAATGGHLTVADKLAILVAAVLLAALTKELVEDRFRAPSWGVPLPKPYALAAVGMCVVVAGALLQLHEVDRRESTARLALHKAQAGRGQCFGASALRGPTDRCVRTTSGRLTPDPLAAASDKSDAYAAVSHSADCWSNPPNYPVTTCVRGEATGTTSVALVGNSHAGQWLPALERIARARHWKITAYLASECAAADVEQAFDERGASAHCRGWGRAVARTVAEGHYDLVVYANRESRPAAGDSLAASTSAYAAGYRRTLTALAATGTPVAVIRDTPAPGGSIPDCLSRHPEDYGACDGTRARWTSPDGAVAAVRALRRSTVTLVDMTKYLCPGRTCPAVIGDVPVYFDGSHMTATYAATLSPYLSAPLLRALR